MSIFYLLIPGHGLFDQHHSSRPHGEELAVPVTFPDQKRCTSEWSVDVRGNGNERDTSRVAATKWSVYSHYYFMVIVY